MMLGKDEEMQWGKISYSQDKNEEETENVRSCVGFLGGLPTIDLTSFVSRISILILYICFCLYQPSLLAYLYMQPYECTSIYALK